MTSVQAPPSVSGTVAAILGIFFCHLLVSVLAVIDSHQCPVPFSCLTYDGTVQTPLQSTLCGIQWADARSVPCVDNSWQLPPLCNSTTFDCADTGRLACPAYPAGNTTAVCINPSKMCDGVRDCFGGTDEDPKICTKGNPGSFNCSTAWKVWCPSGTGCVPESALCDGLTLPMTFQGCGDGSDENVTFCASYTCPPTPSVTDRMRCPTVPGIPNSYQCISASALCDGMPNCAGGQDEDTAVCSKINCTTIGKRKCPGGVGCLAEASMCNGMVDCSLPGNSVTDEDLSVCKSYNCSLTGRAQCPDGSKCIFSESLFCDGFPDCPPGDWGNVSASSEESPSFCASYNCSRIGKRKCPGGAAAGYKCIDEKKFCDGMNDCDDGSDEDPAVCAAFDCTKTGRGKCKAGPPFCIDIAGMCDGTSNNTRPKQCIDGSDEGIANCKGFNCSINGRISCPSGIHCMDSAAALCDGFSDCDDGSDENSTFCKNFNCAATNRTLCPSRVGCMPWGSQCNGVPDCGDGSDEDPTFCRYFSCSSIGAFKCPGNKKQCIYRDSVCDGVKDCTDGSDETTKLCKKFDCSMQGKVRCPRVKGQAPQCTFLSDFCDGKPDCPGGTDEAPYTNCKKFACPFGSIKCPVNNTCVPGILCNGLPEDCRCSPGHLAYDEDPTMCQKYKCPTGYVKCKDKKQCIPKNAMCDNVADCNDKSDEDPKVCTSYDCTRTGRIPCPGGQGYCLSSTCSICDGTSDCPKVDGKYTSGGNYYYPDEDLQYCSLRSATCPSVPSIATF